ncbi:DUF1918 domain-containing protein [Streptomyces subrutilus]|uniref:DUF1918 domain-containing protein n=1 Tax=Streptomyces subrutilus TaxID=36818 RepID=A0A5P2UQI6_9ACTN|nr:DUF1918 domain-containing protein [Streptomyces subrutilus]QEU81383.1 DUF1918 domain-containing protein [Streptomyces subrutilus]WSJ29282.1 DUF1918 domain-containing protein [Streptomyces subrutilus]GGZ87555.1 hypothetical protein GCM10010371_54260 [Streptomyces subrutilus]
MRATEGDQLVQHGRIVGQQDKVGEITQVLGDDGTPPYRVRFQDGHEALMAPGPDCTVRHPGGHPR